MVTTLHALAFALYLAALGSLVASLAGGRRTVRFGGTAVAGAAVLVHAVALATFATAYDELPLVGLAPSLSTLAFLIGVLQLATAAFREGRPLGLVLVPIDVLLLGIALALGLRPAGEALAFRGAWFVLHVSLAFVGYAGLAVAFAAGLMYLLQLRELKGKRFGRMFRFFPSLEATDRLGRRALLVGFCTLTPALLLGWAWTIRFQRTLATDDPEVIWGMLTWLVFAAALLVRSGGGRGDRRGAVATVVGFLVVVFAFVALRLSMADGRWFL